MDPRGDDSTQPRAGGLTVEPYLVTAKDGQTVEAELGRLVVPERRSRPQGNQIEVAFVRFRSTAARPGPPVIYLAGGPGGSGIGTARGPRFHQFMAMRAVGDVIALDQRGVGLSKPNLRCREPLGYPLDRPAVLRRNGMGLQRQVPAARPPWIIAAWVHGSYRSSEASRFLRKNLVCSANRSSTPNNS
jgi:pimeloyl-ACP methyl ester carboxylesterase